MADRITISPAAGTWTIRAGGAILGESTNALELKENGYPTRIYFPRDDIAMAFLDDSDTKTVCPYKGDANYFSIVTKSTTIKDAAWSYETPIESVSEIVGHLSFADDERITIEQI
ncbi:MAG: DUF427 domain-containing protein [Boseongicola sp.]|nr:MAG: DUF427 domain-containing protein [Boseongicola sp.]